MERWGNHEIMDGDWLSNGGMPIIRVSFSLLRKWVELPLPALENA
jgi:hypothetical protein